MTDPLARIPADDSARTTPTASSTVAATPSLGTRIVAWIRKAAIAVVAIIVAAIVYVILAAFLPRWWAGEIGRNVGGSFGRGIGTGLVLGFVCTFIPLLLIGFAVLTWTRLKHIPAYILAILGVVAAIPNLLTLSVVLGGGNGAHAGQRIFDVDAPAFRASTLWGAVVAVGAAAVVGYLIWRYRRRGRQLQQLRVDS
ncbi:MAG: hypothetical protein QM673_00260 [Gordonia sp. (in: high G+C Gram-positive bacteria)]